MTRKLNKVDWTKTKFEICKKYQASQKFNDMLRFLTCQNRCIIWFILYWKIFYWHQVHWHWKVLKRVGKWGGGAVIGLWSCYCSSQAICMKLCSSLDDHLHIFTAAKTVSEDSFFCDLSMQQHPQVLTYVKQSRIGYYCLGNVPQATYPKRVIILIKSVKQTKRFWDWTLIQKMQWI